MSCIPHVEYFILEQDMATCNTSFIPATGWSQLQDKIFLIFSPGSTIGELA
jgi:hypothetical protein